MRATSLAAAGAAMIAITVGGSAMAQSPSTSGRAASWVQTGDAAYPPPPNAPPAGTHYEWIFSYDRHGNYLGHWQIVRNH